MDAEIGERIRAARHAQGITQRDLAGELGLAAQQLQKYEDGSNRVSTSRLVEIARVLTVPVVTLLPTPEGRSKVNARDLTKLIALFGSLSPKHQQRALNYIQALAKED